MRLTLLTLCASVGLAIAVLPAAPASASASAKASCLGQFVSMFAGPGFGRETSELGKAGELGELASLGARIDDRKTCFPPQP